VALSPAAYACNDVVRALLTSLCTLPDTIACPCSAHTAISPAHGSWITSNEIWGLVITGKLLIITGDSNYWQFSAPKLLVIWDAHAKVGARFHKKSGTVSLYSCDIADRCCFMGV
jgi:hypothetical protein